MPDSGAYFGSTLDLGIDSAAAQTQRLGAPAAVLEHVASVPISEEGIATLSDFIQQARSQGALVAVTLEPTDGLGGFDASEATEVVDALAAARGDDATPLYVRFAPDMNTDRVPWGQRPDSYVVAFRSLSRALHAGLPGAAIVWSPAERSLSAVPLNSMATPVGEETAALDTNSDGVVGAGDDPYGPYYPGDSAVDWVGLSVYHDDSDGGAPTNNLPAAGELESALSGGPDESSADFYTRYADEPDQPMMLETAALYSPGAGGPSALGVEQIEIKRTWWRQVIAVTSDRPFVKVVLWRDSSSARAASSEIVIDWSISGSPDTAAAFRSDATASNLVFGPVYTPAAPAAPGGELDGVRGWALVALVALAAAGLIVWSRRGRLLYDGPPNRDLRIDLLRGVAIVIVVVDHLALTSVVQNLTREAVGLVSGAELFILLSGAVLGMVHRPTVVGGGIGEVTLTLVRRSGKLYLIALAMTLAVGGISLLGFVNTGPVTTYVDGGTGGGTNRVYDLYTSFASLVRYPVDPSIVIDLVLLRMGPWQMDIVGLYIALLATAPLVLWALSRRRWIAVLGVSWALYAVQAFLGLRVLPSRFEGSFPLLAWQVLFVTGIVAGFHRREIVSWFAARSAALSACVVATILLAVFSWNIPSVSSADIRLGLVPPNVFSAIQSLAFERTPLGLGRVLTAVLLAITGYAALTAFWKPVRRLIGWFFIPLGQAPLYVFVVHILFVLIIVNLPLLNEGNILINTIASLVILALVWTMVRTRFLFRVVPR